MHFSLPSHSLLMMGFVLLLLIIGTVISRYKAYKNPDKDYRELQQRVNSWWWMIGIIFLSLGFGHTAALVLFALISFLALKEFFSIVPIRQTDRHVVFWAYVAIPVQYYWVAIEWHTMFLIFIPVYLFLFIPLRMVMLGDTQGFIRSAGVLHWGVMLTVFCISHLAALMSLDTVNENAGGIGLVLFVLFLTQCNDVMQYVWGKQLGKHKIIPKVSPNKTWEGFLGGLVSSIILAMLLGSLLTPMRLLDCFFAGALIACAGFIGDVVISSVKRDLVIKDSGNLIPGHGGILDRIDSLTYSVPLFFHFYYYFYV